jgi:hypothetical protein
MPSKTKKRNDPYIRSLVGKQLLAFIQSHPDKPWDWRGISSNPNITMETIEAHPDKPWNWWMISSNPNLTMEMIQAHPDKPWNWSWISYNPLNGMYDQIHERYLSRLMLVSAHNRYRASV